MSEQFEAVWKRIVRHAGEQFRTTTGQVFRYEIVDEDKVRVVSADAVVTKGDLARYHEQASDAGSGKIAVLTGGPSFVWAILTDSRIQVG